MFDPVATMIRLRPLAAELALLMARLPPGTPEYQAAYSAHSALRRADQVIASSPRWTAPLQGDL